jgi:hypothetical protein
MSPPSDGSYTGGLLGGFLLQKGSSVAGSIVYAVTKLGQVVGTAGMTQAKPARFSGRELAARLDLGTLR